MTRSHLTDSLCHDIQDDLAERQALLREALADGPSAILAKRLLRTKCHLLFWWRDGKTVMGEPTQKET